MYTMPPISYSRWIVALVLILAAIAILYYVRVYGVDSRIAPLGPVKIMPLGDSITESYQGLHSYRFFLWRIAIGKGYRIDLVGSQRGVHDGAPANRDFDMDHEGHWGWRADEVLAQIHGWVSNASPDFVLIHLGHNDLCQGKGIADTVNNVATIIDEIRIFNPKVRVLLAQVIASSQPCHSEIPLYNAELVTLAAAKSRPESPVIPVDQYRDFEPASMTWDGVHPNAKGEARMADRWFEKLEPLLDVFFAELAPSQ
jgi:acyl-CoA thioesterase-1